ncbi:MAG: hypothetical protein D6820_00920, partial [Lentisphaerae bacterium]
ALIVCPALLAAENRNHHQAPKKTGLGRKKVLSPPILEPFRRRLEEVSEAYRKPFIAVYGPSLKHHLRSNKVCGSLFILPVWSRPVSMEWPQADRNEKFRSSARTNYRGERSLRLRISMIPMVMRERPSAAQDVWGTFVDRT